MTGAQRSARLPLIGREDEIAAAIDRLETARSGSGASIVVIGPAGVGKSRLLEEIGERAASDGALVLRATAERGPALRPHDLILQLLTGAVIELERLGRSRPAPLFDAISRLESGGDDLGRSSTLTSFVQALNSIGTHPIVLLVDDLHWADHASAETLRELGGFIDRLHLVAVRARRPDTGRTVTELRSTVEIALGPLDRPTLAAAVAERFSIPVGDADAVAGAIVSLGGDVPAVLEHLLATAGAGGDADPATLADRLAMIAAAEPREVMSIRLASLNPWTREVLSVAAVLGREFASGEVVDLVDDGGVDAVQVALDEAEQRGLIVPFALGRFRFSHPLVAELLYDRLSPGRRSRIHRRAAELLEAAGSHRLIGAARHVLASGRAERTDPALIVAAGMLALERSAFDEAVELLEAALRIGPGSADDAEVLLALGHALRGAGRRREARERFEDVVETTLTRSGSAELAIEAAIGHAEGGDFRVGAGESAVIIDRVLDRDDIDESARARLLAAKVRVSAREDRVVRHVDVGDVFALGGPAQQDRVQWSYTVRTTVAHGLADEAIARAEASGDPHALLESIAAWRSVHRSPHDLDERSRQGRRGIDLADRLGRRAEGVELRGWLAVDHLERGDRSAFDLVAAEVDQVMGRFGTHRLHWMAAGLRTLTQQLDGTPTTIADAAKEAAGIDVDVEVPGRWTALAILLWRAGELADDRTFARSLSAKHPDIFDQAASSAMLGLSRMRDGDVDSARELLDHALRRLRQGEHEISWLLSVHAVADLAVEIADEPAAEELVPLLEPWVDRVTIGNHGTVLLGPIALPLAGLGRLVGMGDDWVEQRFVDADRLSRGLRSTTFAAETLLAESMWRADRGEFDVAASRARAAFRIASRVGLVRVRRQAALVLDRAPRLGVEPWELTDRQSAILRLMANGLSNPRIAVELAFSLSTVAKETSAIYRALDVEGRDEAVEEFRRHMG